MSGAGRSAARAWLLAAVAGAACAGFVGGLIADDLRRAFAASADDDPDRRYVRELVERYGLDPRQERLLHLVLQAHDRELRRILRRDLERLPTVVRTEIADADLLMEERIKSVLTDAQRSRFLQDSRPVPIPAAGADGGDRDRDASPQDTSEER